MILRAAIVFLLVLNLGVAAWWIGGGNAAPAQPAAPMPADVPSLRLVAEAADPSSTTTTTAVPPAAPPPPEQGEAPAPAPAAVAEQCLRFGPFADAAERDAARVALTAAGVSAQPRDTPARSGRGWKVHLPPFATREEAVAMGERIKGAGIKDWYLLNEGADANGIALGRYGGEEAARRREAELKSKGIPAVAEALGDSAAQQWLEARLPTATRRGALAAIAPSRSVDCATLR